MTTIEWEKQTIEKMVRLFCRHRLHQDTPSEEYLHLTEYALKRLDHCRFGNNKPACKNCPIHCYAPKERAMVREIMRWTGPRMMLYAPLDAIRHVWRKISK